MGVIVVICVLVLIAYVFDITSSKTKVPSVVLLLALGWLVGQIVDFIDFEIPPLLPVLPLLGTVGLILIVLEGALELELNKKKLPVLGKSFLSAFVQLFALSFIIGYVLSLLGDWSFKDSLTNVIPLCVISSSVAIPSAVNLARKKKEFVIYESSLSDILGVIFFNFVALNAVIGADSFLKFFLQMLAIVVISFITTGALSWLMSKIDHHVKFVPIIFLVILIYIISKEYHLPALVFILVFGLFLRNLDELHHIKFIQMLHPEELNKEVDKFKDLNIEAAFLIRALFFLLFGYLLKLDDILNPNTVIWASGIVLLTLLVRAIHLKLSKLRLMPLLFVAPRGLITILLFLSIPQESKISEYVNNSLVIQVILIMAVVMMVGLMFNKKKIGNVPRAAVSGEGELTDPPVTSEEEIK